MIKLIFVFVSGCNCFHSIFVYEWFTWKLFTSARVFLIACYTVQPAWRRSRWTLLRKVGVKRVCGKRERDYDISDLFKTNMFLYQHPLLVPKQHSYQRVAALNQRPIFFFQVIPWSSSLFFWNIIRDPGIFINLLDFSAFNTQKTPTECLLKMTMTRCWHSQYCFFFPFPLFSPL